MPFAVILHGKILRFLRLNKVYSKSPIGKGMILISSFDLFCQENANKKMSQEVNVAKHHWSFHCKMTIKMRNLMWHVRMSLGWCSFYWVSHLFFLASSCLYYLSKVLTQSTGIVKFANGNKQLKANPASGLKTRQAETAYFLKKKKSYNISNLCKGLEVKWN